MPLNPPHTRTQPPILTPARISTALATLLAALVLLPLLGHRILAEWDEGIYADVSREMLHAHSWITPLWNGEPWLEKPPLLFWITALSYKLFGLTEFAARLPSSLSGIALVALLHRWLHPREGPLAAWISTLILLSTFGFLHLCRVGETDVLLSLSTTLALIGLTALDTANHPPQAQTQTPSQTQTRRPQTEPWMLFFLGFSLATLTKGAAAIVLPLTAILVAALHRWPRSRFGRPFNLGLALFAALVLPWHLLMLHRFGPTFLHEYLGFHVLARATRLIITDHPTHPWYYIGVLLVSAAPWVVLYPFALAEALRKPNPLGSTPKRGAQIQPQPQSQSQSQPSTQTNLQTWAIFALTVLVFFSLAQTRLPHYIAPAYPALTLITAVWLARRLHPLLSQDAPNLRRNRILIPAAATLICLLAIALTSRGRSHLRTPTVVNGTPLAQDKDAVLLVREVAPLYRTPNNPLLLWRAGPIQSIAATIFYARRPVQQVVLDPTHPTQTSSQTRDKYFYNPQPLTSAVRPNPSLIVLDKSLVPLIPLQYRYYPLQTRGSVQIGLILLAPVA